MSKYLGVAVLLALATLLAACAPAATPTRTPIQAPVTMPPSPTEAPATAVPDPAKAPAVENNRLLLARQLHIDPTAIQVISAEKVEWSDSCLGLGGPAESCAAVITPGYKITFDVAGQEYVIHTDEGGYQTRVASAPEPATGETIIAWSGPLDMRGCAESIIGQDGVGFGLCGATAKLGGKFASEARQDVLGEMAAKYASFEGNNEFGSIRFTGKGSTAPTAEEQRLITRWAQMVTMEAGGGESLAGMEYRGPAEMGNSDTSNARSWTGHAYRGGAGRLRRHCHRQRHGQAHLSRLGAAARSLCAVCVRDRNRKDHL
jgi:hypothetical protein